MRKRNIHRRIGAYFTVEAAMVLTMVIGILVFLVYLMFFQYDRCLTDQDVGALALKGCSLQAENKEELLQKLENYAAQIDTDKYIAWNHEKINITLKENKVRVEQTGSLRFPFGGFGLKSVNSVWETESGFENRCISPVSFLRNYRKIQGGK